VVSNIVYSNDNASNSVDHIHPLNQSVKMKNNTIQDTQRILELIAKRDLDDDGKICSTSMP
jgi:hypothetical protein